MNLVLEFSLKIYFDGQTSHLIINEVGFCKIEGEDHDLHLPGGDQHPSINTSEIIGLYTNAIS